MSIGARLLQHYDGAARIDTTRMRDSLQRIEQHLTAQGQAESDEDIG
jgi:hypothetical protein